jgi:hypothetical protein
MGKNRIKEEVSRRIKSARRYHRIRYIIMGCAGVAVLAILTSWITTLTGYIAMVSNIFANLVVVVALSPIAWVIGSGLPFFIKSRL